MSEVVRVTDLSLEQAQKDHAFCIVTGGAAQTLPQGDEKYTVVCTFDAEDPTPPPTTAPAAVMQPAGPFAPAPGLAPKTKDGFTAHMKAKLGAPYIWGADGPDTFDCSGFAQYALDYLGLDPIKDQNSRMLYSHFRKNENGRVLSGFEPAKLGDLAFYGHKSSVSHVSVCLDATQVIEAGGGGSSTRTPTPGAEVRIVALNRRSDLVAIVRPNGVPSW